jgi:hypothetical protein
VCSVYGSVHISIAVSIVSKAPVSEYHAFLRRDQGQRACRASPSSDVAPYTIERRAANARQVAVGCSRAVADDFVATDKLLLASSATVEVL